MIGKFMTGEKSPLPSGLAAGLLQGHLQLRCQFSVPSLKLGLLKNLNFSVKPSFAGSVAGFYRG
ncbi:hypothetical protein [Hymenobacter yonginensis]|uniref:Uncharacterized protein n=1 Tax=Hymenobacter yonginensis TaxID=748197 RepID=A0ABY7PS14_9BACT|nr:hypothetical protein [Hymenobacter yonginensis]WBO85658.1 hypothetical protein O9Z63_05280 [Hymenobacter yonginensis]